MGQSTAPTDEHEAAPLFYSEQETASLLGIHRTTLRTLALAGKAPVEPIPLTEHKRVYRRVDVQRLAGLTK
ncbi:helix-turn-helix transcriptional regulator [Leucobacter soli]|uniref:Uncharacterized protein n=1 Tax=Leucobacter soli TaxID=2812850 RepID=A0A916NUW1_9MICO|nr:hypothetical protein [Leucobacter soli]CAG7600758.1 hypothetical protein LEUCIP111803_00398 [Leucobacter soli]